MESLVNNVVEKSDALVLCFDCGHWGALSKSSLEFKNCKQCTSLNTVRALHWQWASWYNATRGYVNIPFKRSIRISFDTPAYRVLNALRNKYA